MVKNDLTQRIRDKSVFIFSLVIPLSLMGVLNLAFGGFGPESVQLKPASVVVSNDGLLDQLGAGTVTALAGHIANLPPEVLAGLGQQTAAGTAALTLSEGQAAAEQLSLKGTLVAGQSGLFLFFTVGFLGCWQNGSKVYWPG